MAAITAQQTDKGPVFSLPQAGEMMYVLGVQEDGKCTLASETGDPYTLKLVNYVLVPVIVRVRATIVNGLQELLRLQDFALTPGESMILDLRTLGWEKPITEVGVEIFYGETELELPLPTIRAAKHYDGRPGDINVTLNGDPMIPASPKASKAKERAPEE